MIIYCPKCNARYEVSSNRIGEKVTCDADIDVTGIGGIKCGAIFTIQYPHEEKYESDKTEHRNDVYIVSILMNILGILIMIVGFISGITLFTESKQYALIAIVGSISGGLTLITLSLSLRALSMILTTLSMILKKLNT